MSAFIRASTDPGPAESQNRDVVALFAALWAAASLFHSASGREWAGLWPVNLAAAWVLVQPGRIVPLALLALAQAATTWAKSPFIANHLLLTALINIALVAAIAFHVFFRRRAAVADTLVADWAPAVRLSVIVFYFFVVFHKLNADFFDAGVSCAADFYRAELVRLPFLPPSAAAEAAAIYFTILSEAAIPLLLLSPATRLWGVAVGIGFHGVLALNPKDGFYNFSAMLIPVFCLFAVEALRGRMDDAFRRSVRVAARGLLALFVALAAAQTTGVAAAIGVPDPFLLLWVAFSTSVLAIAVAAAVPLRPAGGVGRSAFALPSPAVAWLPVVVFLNGVSPYVGLKTETSWAMFSNLRTEAGQSNHWIVPASVQVFGYQRDLVGIVEASDSGLQAVADAGYAIPYFEVRRKPAVAIEYTRNGRNFRYDRVSDDPLFPGPIPWLLRKTLSFRPVAIAPRQPCVH